MGYYASFDFNLTIRAENVAAAEKILFEHASNGFALEKRLREGRFAEVFDDMWGEPLATEKEITPLQAVASGVMRGEVGIEGSCHKKWRSWEESLLEALAPFCEAEGWVVVRGEDDDCPQEWDIVAGEDGNFLSYNYQEPIRMERRGELEAKEKSLEKAEDLLKDILLENSISPTLADRINSYFNE